MKHKLVELEVVDSIATLWLNRPDRRNAMNDEMRAEFVAALECVAREKAIRALVLSGQGKGFCAGGDVAGMEERMRAPATEVAFNGWSRQQSVHRAQSLLYMLPKPTIAAVNGAAVGLGADIALACDFIVASERASFKWGYVLRGLVPDGGGMYFLPRRVGLPRAKELIFSGRGVGVDEALALGIVDRKFSVETLVSDAQQWAAEISVGSSTALSLSKTILNQSFELSIQQTFMQGSQAQSICYTSAEHRESVMAFLSKRDVSKR